MLDKIINVAIQSVAKYFDKKASSFLHPSIESVVQHFESDAQHFYMTLMNIHNTI